MTMTQAANSYYDTEIGTTLTILLVDMDTGIDEQVVFNSADDCYTVLLNSRCSDEAMRSAFQHARGHILNGDFDKDQVQRIEAYAHGLAEPEEQIAVEEPVPEKPKRKQTREDDLSLAECHKRVQEEYWALYCKNMVAKLRKKREEREKLDAAQEQRRKEFTADMARLGLSVEDIVTTDEYGFPIVRTALVAGTDTVLGYWEQKK